MTDKTQPQPTLNIFSLIRLKPECKILPTRVDFSPSSMPNNCQPCIIPTFNNDGLHYTPAFSLPTDRKFHIQNLQFEKSQFEEQIQRSLHLVSNYSIHVQEELKVVVPNSNYCQICQEKFESYFDHIYGNRHVNMSKSEGSENIEKICRQFNNKVKRLGDQDKTKGIKKTARRSSKKVNESTSNKSTSKAISQEFGLGKTQNNSTCLIEDTMQ